MKITAPLSAVNEIDMLLHYGADEIYCGIQPPDWETTFGSLNWLNRRATKLQVSDTQNGFRAYTFSALKSIAHFESNGYSVESEQLLLAQKVGLRIQEVSISTEYENLEKTSNQSYIL